LWLGGVCAGRWGVAWVWRSCCPLTAAKRSELAERVEYGYCASHSWFFRGLRPALECTLGGLRVGFAPPG
jgi:hypothetical protein